jgi:ABC-type proline/glycine betaine transport system substrate-binding protein
VVFVVLTLFIVKTYIIMGRVFKLTEEQYRKALEEQVVDSVGNISTSGKPKQVIPVEKTNTNSLDNSFKTAQSKLKNPNDPDTQFVIVDKTNNGLTNESYVISRSELSERRRKIIEENTKMYSVDEFLNMINK